MEEEDNLKQNYILPKTDAKNINRDSKDLKTIKKEKELAGNYTLICINEAKREKKGDRK